MPLDMILQAMDDSNHFDANNVADSLILQELYSMPIQLEQLINQVHLNTEWYSPEKTSFTKPRVEISIRFTFFSISFGIINKSKFIFIHTIK